MTIIHKRFEEIQEQFSTLSIKVQENLAGVQVVKAFVRERHEIDRFLLDRFLLGRFLLGRFHCADQQYFLAPVQGGQGGVDHRLRLHPGEIGHVLRVDSGALLEGELVIGTSDTMACYVLPPVIDAFRTAHPGVELFAKFSPDGKWIVFCRARSFMLLQPDSELYIIPAAGGEARRKREPLWVQARAWARHQPLPRPRGA